MCANYHPVTVQDRLLEFFAVERPAGQLPPELFPGGLAPFVVRGAAREQLEREARAGLFGLLPHWARELAFGRHTYNARSETVASKPSFRDAWRRGQRCIVPVEAFYEPCWESGRSVRWRIGRADGRPLGVAGLWDIWHDAAGQRVLSFTMLTVNADAHALMRRFHRAGDEKRMLAILDDSDYDTWLDAPTPAAAAALLRPWPAERLVAEPAPRR